MRPVVDSDVAYFRSIGVTFELADEGYSRDWTGAYGTNEKVWVAFPQNTTQVAHLLRYCFEQDIAVTPQGGNTGLVGGSVPLSHEVIISLKRMNSVTSFDPISGTVVCDAGCTLGALDDHVKAHGHTVPLDLGPRDQCQIGGNIATNAGGLRFCRWGSLHGSVVGVEAVLADGTVLDLGISHALQKDNTGYGLKHLFIGSEGTLGVITKCALVCPIMFQSVQLAWIRCAMFQDVIDVLVRAKRELGEILSAFECLDEESLRFARTVVGVDAESRLWRASDARGGYFVVIIETRGSNERHDLEKFGDFLRNTSHPAGLCDENLQRDVWKVRTSVSSGLRKSGATFKYDISLRVDTMEDMIDETKRRLRDHGADGYTRVCGFGHLLDGNVHLNVSCQPSHEEEVRRDLEPWVYQEVSRRHGSISAEHGIGCMKAGAFAATKEERVIHMMKMVKGLFDAKGLMNPHKLFP